MIMKTFLTAKVILKAKSSFTIKKLRFLSASLVKFTRSGSGYKIGKIK